ncbi:MAG TPA: Gfo/Idh/MocA family oxidoreductase [Bryobacteraceae bacterium]|nr:Gfo/Idh/MocA family oxidoreductase [Bryobacteraceae bacterium]
MKKLTRRQLAVGAVSLAGTRALAQQRPAPDRLRGGVIGCGIRGVRAHIATLLKMKEADAVDITAVCDVFDKRAQQAAQMTGAKPYQDYRRLLEDKDIDFVVIATPDHLHAQMAIDAASAGKHIYCEKPMTHSVDEAKRVVAKVRETSVKMQVGVQGMSDDSYETAYKYVKDGVLGKVVIAQIDYSRNYRGDYWLKPFDSDANPGLNLNWDLFQGPAKHRPWDPERYFNWIRYYDYSGGVPAGLFVHRVTRIIKSLGLTFPEFGSAHGGTFQFTESKAEVPDTINIMLDYPGGPTVLLISSLANDTPVDHVLRGHKATLEFTPTGFTIRPQKLYEKEVKEIVHVKTGGEDTELHLRNLLRAIRFNEPLKCDEMLGYYGVVACQFGVLSLQRRKYLKWDKAGERIVNI